MRPTVAEIRLGALVGNYRLLEQRVRAHSGDASARLIAVIKANAYGHGVDLCGRALAKAGADWLGVTSVFEALQLRAALGASGAERAPRILVMSGFWAGEEAAILEFGLAPQVWERWHFDLLDRAARAAGLGPRSVPVHLELDTGMSRQGVAPGPSLAALWSSTAIGRPGSPVFVEGVLTHFSSPEVRDHAITARQFSLFTAAVEQLRELGVRPRWLHAGNSANAWAGVGLRELNRLARGMDAELLVRPGLALYGVETRFRPPLDSIGKTLQPSLTEQEQEYGAVSRERPEPAGLPELHGQKLEPVLRWKTEIVSVREVASGTPVGYGETFRAPAGGARLALLPVGYADGYRRELSGRGSVLIQGHRVPVAGRISMDQTVVDVSSLPGVMAGDEVVLLGPQGEDQITAWQMADWCNTIPYEVLCGVGARVPRAVV